MNKQYIQEEVYKNHIFKTDELKKAVFENCDFIKCEISNMNLNTTQFINCKMVECNLSMSNIMETQFANIYFESCKLLGLNFKDCSTFIFEVKFNNCTLDYSSFESLKMKDTLFNNSSLKGVDFTRTDLTKAEFIKCNLEEAIFYRSNLKEADFISATNYIIDPEQNVIKKARFSLDGLPGLLNKYDIRIN